ncbi:MAG: HEAT repeat domain-containing protein [Mariniblastus sp.]
MGSYITGVIIAIVMVLGLYAAVETAAGRPVFSTQDKHEGLSTAELKKISAKEADLTADDVRGDEENRIAAILQLGEKPGELKDTFPLLAKLAAHPEEKIKNAAHAAIYRIGEPATPLVRDFFDRDTLQDNRAACSAIRAIGPSCKIYMDDVKALLLSEEKIERRCGLYALQGLGVEGVVLMDEIITCVLDEDFNNRCSACRILESFGGDAAPAIDVLLQLLEEGNPSTRGWAAVCLGSIGAENAGDHNFPELIASKLDAINPVEVQRLLKGLALLGPDAITVVDAVEEKAKHKDGFVRSHAAYALWRITDKGDIPFKLLGDMLADDHLAPEALDLIGRMGPDAFPLLDTVTKKFSSEEAAVREEAAIAVGSMGPVAKKAISKLSVLLEDKDAMVRVAARRAIEKVTPVEKSTEK